MVYLKIPLGHGCQQKFSRGRQALKGPTIMTKKPPTWRKGSKKAHQIVKKKCFDFPGGASAYSCPPPLRAPMYKAVIIDLVTVFLDIRVTHNNGCVPQGVLQTTECPKDLQGEESHRTARRQQK